MARLRGRQAQSVQKDSALAAIWAQQLVEEGLPAVEAAILSVPVDQAVAGIGALPTLGEGVIDLLSRLGVGGHGNLASSAVEALGELRSAGAAAALADIAQAASDKLVRKEARRAIHRLSSLGIRAPSEAPRAPAVVGSREAEVYRVVASAYDGSGNRAVWFGAERRLGDIYMIAVMLNDVSGLVDCVGTDTTKKRFAEREEEMRAADPMSWVELPVDYARQLIEEAADLTRLAGSILAAGYATWEHLIARPAAPLAQPLVYREISGFEARLHPTLQNESELLFDEPEVEPWFFMPEPMRKWVQQLAEPASARAILMPESEESRLERILREAVKEVMTPRVVHGLRRRLEETAYIFLRTDRRVAARRAVAAAVTIEDERPLQPPHPFLKALVARSLRVALTVQRARAEPARLALAP